MIRNLITAAWDMLNEDPLWCGAASCAVMLTPWTLYNLALAWFAIPGDPSNILPF